MSTINSHANHESSGDFFSFKMEDLSGSVVDFANFKNQYKAYLLVNVACMCGLTSSNYRQLVELDQEYRDKGLLVMGFPCGQFGNQEYDTPEEIKNFVTTKFNASFPIFKKIEVNGPGAHPLYNFLKRNSSLYNPVTGALGSISWNFGKFLVDRHGKVIKYFSPQVQPFDIKPDILELINN